MTSLNFRKINIEAYKPGRSILKKKKNIIKLSANESALGMSPKVLKILQSKNYKISKYPDSKAIDLRKLISSKFKCEFNKIICGSGSDEVIQMICQLFLKPGDEVIVPQYSFLMYRIYASIVGAKVVFSKEKNFRVSIEEIIKKVNKKTKIVFIANPNNPTGTYLEKKELISLRKKLNKRILLVVDDAYDEYMKDKKYSSGLKIFKNKKNVFILRTFSKIYGLASLRVGWGYGDRKIIDALNMIKPPFNVNKIAQLCAIESLKDSKFITKSVKHNLFWSNKIKNSLEQFNIFCNKISANFLLLTFDKCKLTANNVEKKLLKKGLILRETKTYGIKNCLRLTIGNNLENKLFLKSIEKIFKNV
jgi:histidinol-phosphate aminotransferase